MTGDRDRPARQSPLADCAAAFLLLSRVPAGWHKFPNDNPPDFTAATWAFPLVGLVIGAIGGAAIGLADMAGLPPPRVAGNATPASSRISANVAPAIATAPRVTIPVCARKEKSARGAPG